MPPLAVPFLYLHHTRLRQDPAAGYLQLVLLELVPAVLCGAALAGPLDLGWVATFLGAYLAFVTLYEIGYLVNDVSAAREGERARPRLPSVPPRSALAVAVAVRVAVFLGLTLVLGQAGRAAWWAFYLLLALAVVAHNVLLAPGLRAVTFVHLAIARFLAPLMAVVIPAADLAPALAPVVLVYALPRLLRYLDVKSGTAGAVDPLVRLRLHSLLLVPASLLTLTSGSALPLGLAAYYLAAWSVAWMAGSRRLGA